MDVRNARIKNVTVGLDDWDRLSARMTFESRMGCCDWGFVLTNPTDSQRLVKLMNYVGTSDVNHLNRKIVRIAIYGSCLRGFGDPIADKFVPVLGEELKEVTEEEFNELLTK